VSQATRLEGGEKRQRNSIQNYGCFVISRRRRQSTTTNSSAGESDCEWQTRRFKTVAGAEITRVPPPSTHDYDDPS